MISETTRLILLALVAGRAAGALMVGLTSAAHATSCADLLRWVASHDGGEIGPITLAASEVRAGVGCYVTRDVEPGELIFAVPDCACVKLSDADAGAGPVVCDRERLALHLARRRMTASGAAQASLP